MNLYVTKLDADARIPTRSTLYAAGYDLYALQDGIILPHSKSIIRTGIAVRIPSDVPPPFKVYGRIAARSGLSALYSLEVGAGVIDADYSNEIRVVLYNNSSSSYMYSMHDRVAQLVLETHITPDVQVVDELPPIDSNRVGGFGSTGL